MISFDGLKRWASYVAEIHIESAPSEYNPHLYVCLSRGRYQLATETAIYSFSDLYNNYYLTFEHLRWDLLKGDQVLLLGLGLGSIPEMLVRNFQKQLRYTAIEIDENVVYLANKYVLSKLDSPIEVQIGDAEMYVQSTERKFDMICMDVFLDDKIPEGMTSMDFLKTLGSRLTDNGVLLFNRLARTAADIKETRAYLDNVFLKVFPHGGYLDVKGNWMLVSDKRFTTNQ